MGTQCWLLYHCNMSQYNNAQAGAQAATDATRSSVMCHRSWTCRTTYAMTRTSDSAPSRFPEPAVSSHTTEPHFLAIEAFSPRPFDHGLMQCNRMPISWCVNHESQSCPSIAEHMATSPTPSHCSSLKPSESPCISQIAPQPVTGRPFLRFPRSLFAIQKSEEKQSIAVTPQCC